MTTTRVERPVPARGRGERRARRDRPLAPLPEDGTEPVTAVVYEWNVHTTKPWMNAMAPLAAPVFALNHDWVMRNGGKGLARLSTAACWPRLVESPRL